MHASRREPGRRLWQRWRWLVLWMGHGACAYGEFWVPADDLQHQPIPSAYVQSLAAGRTLYRVAPRQGQFTAWTYRSPGENGLENTTAPRLTQRLFAVSEPYVWMIPKEGGLLSGVDTEGVIELQIDESWGTRLTEFNSALPDGEFHQVTAASGRILWMGGSGGAARFDPAAWRTDVFDDWNTFDQEGGGLSDTFLGIGYTPSVHALAVDDRVAWMASYKLFRYDIAHASWTSVAGRSDVERGEPRERVHTAREEVSVTWKDTDGKERRERISYKLTRVTRYEPSFIRGVPNGYLEGEVDGVVLNSVGIWVLGRHGVSLSMDGGRRWEHWVATHEDWWVQGTVCNRTAKVGNRYASRKVCVEETATVVGAVYRAQGDSPPGSSATWAEEVAPGEVWIAFAPAQGTRRQEGGLRRWRDGRLEPVPGWRGGNGPFSAIHATAGRVYVATRDRLWRGSAGGGDFTEMDPWSGFDEPGTILALESDSRSLWILTDQGLLRLAE